MGLDGRSKWYELVCRWHRCRVEAPSEIASMGLDGSGIWFRFVCKWYRGRRASIEAGLDGLRWCGIWCTAWNHRWRRNTLRIRRLWPRCFVRSGGSFKCDCNRVVGPAIHRSMGHASLSADLPQQPQHQFLEPEAIPKHHSPLSESERCGLVLWVLTVLGTLADQV